ncbi:hypothetical protein AB0M45_30245 [Nocardia sp. NPDC051787]|uniref:hypothetical protein n=1 Tax=Nocardia sp. NPDC051787 TaxID=3155415 RepID=UPI003423E001
MPEEVKAVRGFAFNVAERLKSGSMSLDREVQTLFGSWTGRTDRSTLGKTDTPGCDDLRIRQLCQVLGGTRRQQLGDDAGSLEWSAVRLFIVVR